MQWNAPRLRNIIRITVAIVLYMVFSCLVIVWLKRFNMSTRSIDAITNGRVSAIASLSQRAQSLSPAVLALTAPVHRISGSVVRMEEDILILQITQPHDTFPPNPTITSTPAPTSTDFAFRIGAQTRLLRQPNSLPIASLPGNPLSFPTPMPTTAPSIRDIRSGDTLMVTTTADMRTSVSPISAATVELPPLPNAIEGKITEYSDSSLIIQGKSLGQTSGLLRGAERFFTIRLPPGMYFVTLAPHPPPAFPPTRTRPMELTKGSTVRIFADPSVDTTTAKVFDAQYLELYLPSSAAPQ